MRKILVIISSMYIFCVYSLSAHTATEVIQEKKESLCIGIITAVPLESGQLASLMQSPVLTEIKGKRTYYRARLFGIDTVLVASRIGKVAAAAATVHLIADYKVDMIIVCGVAGALDSSLHVGDIVVSNSLIQHDIDARPFCARHEIPLMKIRECYPDSLLEALALAAAKRCITNDLPQALSPSLMREFTISQPKAHTGLIVTGDQVISRLDQKSEIKDLLPHALCVEMEGASVGQICYEYDIPCVVLRIISDYANHEHAHIDIKKFVQHVSGTYAEALIKNMYSLIKNYAEEIQYSYPTPQKTHLSFKE